MITALQYQAYYNSMILDRKDYDNIICNKYIPLVVRHPLSSHVDLHMKEYWKLILTVLISADSPEYPKI